MDIERKFNIAMRDIYDKAKRECGYVASRFLQMVAEKGGIAAAKSLIAREGGTEGFTRLWECGRLDLSVEALVLSKEFSELFTEEEKEICRKRLEQYKFDISLIDK